jgi:hypothetical protein
MSPASEKTLLVHVDNLFLLGVQHPERNFILEGLKSFTPPKGWRVKILFDYLRDESLNAELGRITGWRVISGANVAKVLDEIGRADAVVSGKFHVALLALTLGKPTLGISPHPKVVDLFGNLKIPENHRPLLSSGAEARDLLAAGVSARLSPEFEQARLSAVENAATLYQQISDFARKCSVNGRGSSRNQ